MLARPPRRARLLVVPAALFLVLAGCGDDDDTTADSTEEDREATSADPAETAAGATPTSEPATTDPASTSGSDESIDIEEYVDALGEAVGGDEEGSECVARAVLEAIGTERVEASGVAPEELANAADLGELGLEVDPSTVDSLQSDLEDCPDLVALFGEAAGASEEDLECVGDAFSQAQIAELIAIQFTGGTPSQELVDAQATAAECRDGN